jgi:hypothetical protein
MSILALNAVFKHSKTKHGARLLMLALADRANDRGKAWPGIEDLMHRTGLSRSSINENTKEAVALGELQVEPYCGPHHTHRYTLQILNRSDSGPFRIETDTFQILDPNPPDSGPKPSLTLKNPHSLDRESAKTKPKAAEDPEFAAFWDRYPRKTAKPTAIKAWRATIQDRPPVAELLVALDRHIVSGQWRENRFVPHPATWLNQHRWADEIKTSKPTKAEQMRVRL